MNNVVADKGYDSEKNHELINDDLGGNAIIPPRIYGSLWRSRGLYRKNMRRRFPIKLYHEREKIETVNSVQKRKFGDELRGRLLRMQRREMKAMDVVHNIRLYVNCYFSFFIGFLQSLTLYKTIYTGKIIILS